jgi:hypothetical protein
MRVAAAERSLRNRGCIYLPRSLFAALLRLGGSATMQVYLDDPAVKPLLAAMTHPAADDCSAGGSAP